MRARLLKAALCAGFLVLGRAAPARAQGNSILVRVGTNISGRAGDHIDVPVIVDLSGAPGRSLGGYTATLSFNPALLSFDGAGNGDFATPQVNANHASDSGTVRLTAIQPSGASGAVVLFYARFHVVADTAQSPVTISFSEMSATATSVTPFEGLLPLLRIVNGTFCKSLGRWGDVNGDGQANSFDALVALSVVVGIEVDQPGLNPALADVDADGKVTSRDALIILSYAVGLPVTGYRVLLNAPGACGASSPITIVINPDSLELQVGQTTPVVFAALDSLGHSVSTDTGTVTSSDPSVAAWVNMEGGGAVQARAPGVAILTARLGPGVAATFKVVVLARRTTWYVDVERARLVPTQLGNQALPMEFIGDALGLAHDGDTVRVASGIYEERVSGNVAVTILGDLSNRPVVDPRGAPSWYSSSYAVDLEPASGQIVLANLVVRAGRTFLAAHDVTVRNVRIEGLGTNGYAALEMQTAQPYEDAPPARPAGPQRSNVPAEPGNALVDGVVVLADSTSSGIVVAMADTAVIRNSSVTRALAGTYALCGTGPYEDGAVLIQQASVSIVHDNVVANPMCQGIGVFDPGNSPVIGDVGRVTISHNRVMGAPGTGIAAGARLVALDHNAVQNTGLGMQRTYGATAGIHVIRSGPAPDSITSLGDTVSNSGGRGFAVDTAGAATIDSLVVAGTGQDSSSYGSFGVDLEYGGHFALSHSRIANTVQDNGVNVGGSRTVFRSHGNHIVGAGNVGISASPVNCDCSDGPDTLISVADTILGSSGSGVYSSYGVYALVDLAVVDSAGVAGISIEHLGRATVSNSMARRAFTGIYSNEVDSLSVLRDTVEADTNGVYVTYTTDSATIRGTVARANTGAGFYLAQYATARIDSSVATNNLDGLYVYDQAGARVRWTRFQDNGRYGIWMDSYAGASSKVDSSAFIGNVEAGARNDAYQWSDHVDTLFADTNYWGHPNGPSCDIEFVSATCLSPAGDSIASNGITFTGWLVTPAPTPAPRLYLASSRRIAGARPAASAALRGAPHSPDRASMLGASARPRPAAPAVSPASALAAAAQRPPHQQPPSWHAPSKARTHSIQITVRKKQ